LDPLSDQFDGQLSPLHSFLDINDKPTCCNTILWFTMRLIL
jgi:hypothetical protein